MIVDFHMHSRCSDGQLTPQQLVALAAERGCEQIAITDHDSIAAYEQLSDQTTPVKVIAGCEFSTNWRGREIHVVGLNLDLHNPVLLDGIEHQQRARRVRAERIGELLARQGFSDALAQAKELAAGGSLGRPHFARYLVESGAVANPQQAFKRYLAVGKPAYVRTQWAEIVQVCGWISAAGGVAVLAHPLKYKFTLTKLRALLVAFKEAGGQGMEVISGAQTPDQTKRLATLAAQFGLHASVGSDFHQPGQPWAALGRVAALPERCLPVWSHW
ncbi:MAG: PHP domain-containing protein [Pseudomonadota bacterium]|nr:PHP domain-containing protein [Pseudomonadota bacterium]